MSFKVKHENDKHFVVVHPDGSEFKIAKRGLDHGLIRKIQAYADGGEVEADDTATQDDNSSDHSEDDASIDEAAVPQATPQSPPGSDPGIQAPQAPTADSISQQANAIAGTPGSVPFGPGRTPASAPAPGPTPTEEYNKGFDERRSGIEEGAQAQSQAGQEQAKALQQAQKQQTKFNDTYQVERAKALDERAALEKDIATAKVDPNRFYSKMSTGSKIAAAIGSILSGGKSMDILRDQVKDDINSQLVDLDKKQSLLRSNYAKTGDLNSAMQLTTDQLLSAVKMQVQATAAKATSPEVLARKKELLGAIDQEHAQNLNQMSLVRAQGMANMGGVSVDQEDPRLLGNKDYAAKRVQVGNQAYQANTPKEAEDLRESIATTSGVKGLINRIDQLGPEAAIPGTEANRQATSLSAQLIPSLNHLHKLNRLSAEDIKILNDQFSNPSSFSQMVNKGVKNNALLQTIDNKLEDDLKAKIPKYKGSVKSRLGNRATSGFTR